ncbi:hypothetical protein Tco_0931886, partial [Tanacetum coccineum]
KQKQKSKRRQRMEAEVPQDETKHKETQVLDLEKAKDAQAKEIATFKKRVQRLERKKKSRTIGEFGDHEDASKQGRSIEDIDVDAEQSIKTGEAVTTAGVEDSDVPTIPTTVEETLAQTLMEIKAAKPKAKGIVFHDQEEQLNQRQRELFSMIRKSRDVQAQLEDELIEEEKLTRKQEEEANIALIESWDNT